MSMTVGTSIPVTRLRKGYKIRIVPVTFDSSYAGSGGEALAASDLGFTKVLWAGAAPTGGYSFVYDIANAKIIAYWVDTTTDGAPLAEVAGTTNLSSITANLLVIGY